MSLRLRTYFDRVMLISLKRRPDRLARARQALYFGGWPFQPPQVVAAVDGSAIPYPEKWKSGPGAWGCLRSHQNVLESAIADGVDKLLVLEDDVCLAENFPREVAKFLRNVPDDWDQLMFGGEHRFEFGLPAQVNEWVYRVVACGRTHCYAIRGAFMRRLYQRLSGGGTHDGTVHCDWIMAGDPEMQMQHKVYAPIKFLAGQDDNRSDIFNRRMPKQFWNTPTPEQIVIHLDGPAELASKMREFGLYYGQDVDPEGGPHPVITMAMTFPKQARIERLGVLIKELQWAVASNKQLVAALWHPDLSPREIAAASLWPVRTIRASDLDVAVKALPARLRRVKQDSLASRFVLYTRSDPQILELMRVHGWHSGHEYSESKLGYSRQSAAISRMGRRGNARTIALSTYIAELQKEALELIDGVAVICHPHISIQEVRVATTATVVEMSPQNAQQALKTWHKFVHRDGECGHRVDRGRLVGIEARS